LYQNFTHFQENVYDIKWVIPTSWGVGLVAGALWIYPFGPMAKKTLERRRMAREEATVAMQAAEKTFPQEDDEDSVIDPDEEYVAKPAKQAAPKQAVVAFTASVSEPVEEEVKKPKTLGAKLAAATFNQGKCGFLLCFKAIIATSDQELVHSSIPHAVARSREAIFSRKPTRQGMLGQHD
jgi:hypothetical protein